MEKSKQTLEKLEDAGLEMMDYDDRWSRYRIRLTPEDLKNHTEVIKEIMAQAHNEAGP